MNSQKQTFYRPASTGPRGSTSVASRVLASATGALVCLLLFSPLPLWAQNGSSAPAEKQQALKEVENMLRSLRSPLRKQLKVFFGTGKASARRLAWARKRWNLPQDFCAADEFTNRFKQLHKQKDQQQRVRQLYALYQIEVNSLALILWGTNGFATPGKGNRNVITNKDMVRLFQLMEDINRVLHENMAHQAKRMTR